MMLQLVFVSGLLTFLILVYCASKLTQILDELRKMNGEARKLGTYSKR